MYSDVFSEKNEQRIYDDSIKNTYLVGHYIGTGKKHMKLYVLCATFG